MEINLNILFKSMSKLSKFKEDLDIILSNEGGNLRPFVCKGNPLDCNVFIVGINAATNMDENFSDFWSDKEGFLYDKWFAFYMIKRNGEKSKTRNYIDKISDELKKIRMNGNEIQILETNIYSLPTKNLKALDKKDRRADVFLYLLATIAPKFLLIHGEETIRFFNNEFNLQLQKGEKEEFSYKNNTFTVMAVPHFSARIKNQDREEIHQKVFTYLSNPTS